MLAVLTDGFKVIGVSAYPLQIFFGAAILIAMIANVQLARLRRGGPVMADRRRHDGAGPRRPATTRSCGSSTSPSGSAR